jgi:hypothetical protein
VAGTHVHACLLATAPTSGRASDSGARVSITGRVLLYSFSCPEYSEPRTPHYSVLPAASACAPAHADGDPHAAPRLADGGRGGAPVAEGLRVCVCVRARGPRDATGAVACTSTTISISHQSSRHERLLCSCGAECGWAAPAAGAGAPQCGGIRRRSRRAARCRAAPKVAAAGRRPGGPACRIVVYFEPVRAPGSTWS